jgi:predicted amidohydrolase YtcJ
LAAAARLRDLDGWSDDGRVERDAHHAARTATRDGITDGTRRALQESALTAAARAGIGAVHEMSAPHIAPERDLSALVELVEQRRDASDAPALPDVVAYRGQLVSTAKEASDVIGRLGLPTGLPAGSRLHGLAGDLCVDGSIGSRTAALRSPYADAPGTSGHLYLDAEQIAAHVVACTEAGLQAGFHVIGDAALDEVLRGFTDAAERVGEAALRRRRHRLEHVEMVDAEAIAALARLGVHASVQPVFDALWGGSSGLYAERLGVKRAAEMNPFAALAAAGVPLALGSDSPVTPFDPWGAVAACVFHTAESQRTSARAGFTAHTRGAWRAAGYDDRGVLVPGAPATYAVWSAADLVVQAPDDRIQAWSTDPRSGTPGLPDLSPGVHRPTCLRTVVRGRVAHDVLR